MNHKNVGSRRGSRGSSNASATSTRSNRSLNGTNPEPKQIHVTNNPGLESVTVEITEPKA